MADQALLLADAKVAEGDPTSSARGQRFPLLVGTCSHRSLATIPSWILLVAGIGLEISMTGTTWPPLRIAGQVIALAALLSLASPLLMLAQLGWVMGYVRDAVASRACDIEIGATGVRVHGGANHDFHADFAQLTTEGAIRFERDTLHLEPAGKNGLRIDAPRDADERASLEALAASLRGGLANRAHRDALDRASATKNLGPIRVLTCAGCGAPLVPVAEASVRCRQCGAQNDVPLEVRQKLENAAVVDSRRRADQELCRALRAEPGPRTANVVAFAGGALAATLAVVATFQNAVMIVTIGGTTQAPPWAGYGLVEGGLGLVVMGLVRAKLVTRGALRILTMGFSAIPGEDVSAPARCRNCGAPLPGLAVGDVLTRCVYCDADNLRAIDLHVETELARRFSTDNVSPATTLERARVGRRRAFALAVVGVVFMVVGALRHRG